MTGGFLRIRLTGFLIMPKFTLGSMQVLARIQRERDELRQQLTEAKDDRTKRALNSALYLSPVLKYAGIK